MNTNNNNQNYDNQTYSNQSYDNQTYSNQGYDNQTYSNQDHDNQTYINQGYDNQTYYRSVNYDSTGSGMPYNTISTTAKMYSRILNPSAIFGLISSIFLTLGLFLPAMDFSTFHEEVDIQYNLIKICKNVGLLSSMWMGIPYGIIIGVIGIFVLSFIKIPVLKIIPCLVITAMLILMVADVGNIIEWATDTINKFYKNNDIIINFSEIIKSFLSGMYFLAAGIILGFVSCFFKAPQ